MNSESDDNLTKFLPETSSKFRKDIKKAKKQGKDMAALRDVMTRLLKGLDLEPRHRDHSLGGNWKSFQDCHITPDWLLIYRIDGDIVRFERLGSHSELFG